MTLSLTIKVSYLERYSGTINFSKVNEGNMNPINGFRGYTGFSKLGMDEDVRVKCGTWISTEMKVVVVIKSTNR